MSDLTVTGSLSDISICAALELLDSTGDMQLIVGAGDLFLANELVAKLANTENLSPTVMLDHSKIKGEYEIKIGGRVVKGSVRRPPRITWRPAVMQVGNWEWV